MPQMVTAEDGSLHEFPDEATPEMMASALGLGVASADESVDRNIFTRLEENKERRTGDIEKIADQYVAGQISRPEALGRSGLRYAQQLPDAAGSVIASAFSALPDSVERPIREGASRGVTYLADTGAGRLAGSAVQKYQDFSQKHPVASGRIGAVTDVGNLFLPFAKVGGKNVINATEEIAAPVVRAAGENITAGAKRLNTRTVVPTAEEIKQHSSDLFKAAEAQGANLPAEAADSYRNSVISTLNLGDEAKLYASSPVAERLVKDIGDFRGQPMTFETAKNIDEALGDLAYDTMDNFGKLSAQGKKFLDLQGNLREHMMSVPGNEIVGQARKTWASYLRMREVERIVERAKSREQPTTAIKNGFSALLNRGDKLKGYSTNEIKAIKKAARTGIVTDAFKLAGSGLVPIGAGVAGAVGGPIGSAAGYLTGLGIQQASKAVGVSRQMGRVNKVSKAVAENSGLTRQEPRIDIPLLYGKARDKIKGTRQASPPEASPMLALQAPGKTRAMTDAEIQAAQRTMAKKPSAAAQSGPVRHDYGDVPYNVIGGGQEKFLSLPAPGTNYPPSPRGISDRGVSIARAQMAGGKLPAPGPAGGPLRPPSSQLTRVQNSLGAARKREFNDMVQIFLDGDMSQNDFVNDAMKKYGLKTMQARSLAKEIKTYKPKTRKPTE